MKQAFKQILLSQLTEQICTSALYDSVKNFFFDVVLSHF